MGRRGRLAARVHPLSSARGLGALAPLVLSGLVGCGGDHTTLLLPALPAELVWAGAIFLDQGQEVGATGLVPRSASGRFDLELPEAPRPAAEVWIALFSEADLAGVALPSEAVLRASPLTLAPVALPLPAPSLAAHATPGDEPRALVPAPLPGPLTAAWRPRCPVLLEPDQRGSIYASCNAAPCQPTAEQRGCQLSADLRSCFLGDLSGSIDALGQLSAPVEGPLGRCTPMEPALGGALKVRCQRAGEVDCDVEIFAPKAPPAAIVERRPIAPDPQPSPLPGQGRPPQGTLGQLLLEPDRALVLGAERWTDSGYCSHALPSRLWFLDLESLSLTGTATLPPCVRQLAPLPGGGYVAMTPGPPGRVLELDHHGRVVQELPAPQTATRWASSIVIPSGARRGLMVLMREGGAGEEHSALLWFDTAPLRVLSVRQVDNAELLDAAELSTTVVRVLDDGEDRLLDFDVERGVVTATISLRPNPLSLQRHVGRVLVMSPGSRTLISNGSPDSGVLVVNAPMVRLAPTFERPMEPFALVRTATPGLVLLGVRDRTTRRAGLIRFRDERAELGTLDLGEGAVGELRFDAQGRLWATLPEAGEVLRLELR